MPAYPLRAIVLRKTKLGEADVILNLLASDGRMVRAVAKGLRKPTSKFGGRLEPYSEVDLLLHTGKSLEVIAEVRTEDAHAALREDFDRQAAASVVADVLDKIALEGERDVRLYGLARATFGELEVAPSERLPGLVVAYLVKAMAMHGYRPELDACITCAGDVEESARFSLSGGGVLCESCGTDPSAADLAPEARAWLVSLLGMTMADVAATDVPVDAVRDCFALMRSFVAYHLPSRVRSLDFYASVIGASAAGQRG